MDIQIIEKYGKPEYAVIPYAVYERLLELAEDREDNQAFIAALSTNEESIPQAMVERLVNGDNPLEVWREYRGITQTELATQAGIGKSYLSQIEAGKKTGSARVLQALVTALNVDVDDLLK